MLKNVMLVYYEMTTVTMMVMRKRLKTPKNTNLQNMQLLSQIQNQNITVKNMDGWMYEQFQLPMCLFK